MTSLMVNITKSIYLDCQLLSVYYVLGTKLIAKYQKGTPTSQTAKLLSVTFDMVLALEYSDDPKNYHAQLVLVPEVCMLYAIILLIKTYAFISTVRCQP